MYAHLRPPRAHSPGRCSSPDRPAVVGPGWLVEPHHYPPSTKDGSPVDPAHHSVAVLRPGTWLRSYHHHFHASSDARKWSPPGLIGISRTLRADHQLSLGSWIVNSFVGTESRGRRQLPVRLLGVTVIRRVPTGCSPQFALVLAAGYPGAPQTRSPCDAFVTQDRRWAGARPTSAVDAELRRPLA